SNKMYNKKYNELKDMSKLPIWVEGYERDISFLTGTGGIFLTLLNTRSNNLRFNKLILVG
ncbi:hypothetical protein, partial [Peptoniphilus asaccharolyticus]